MCGNFFKQPSHLSADPSPVIEKVAVMSSPADGWWTSRAPVVRPTLGKEIVIDVIAVVYLYACSGYYHVINVVFAVIITISLLSYSSKVVADSNSVKKEHCHWEEPIISFYVCIILCYIVLCYIILYYIISYYIILYYIILYYIILYYIILYYIILYYIILYYIILYYITLYCIGLYCTEFCILYYVPYINQVDDLLGQFPESSEPSSNRAPRRWHQPRAALKAVSLDLHGPPKHPR